MRRILFLSVISLLCFLGACCNKPTQEVRLIPQPQSIELKSGSYTLTEHSPFYCDLQGTEGKEFIEYLQSSPFGLKVQLTSNSKDAHLAFVIVSDTAQFPSPEAYRLEVSGGGVKVMARAGAGLFYGFQTLLQLAKPIEEGRFSVGNVVIDDAPRFDYRGLHLDVSRHFLSVDFIKKQLDAMARYKLNQFHWHLTDGAGWRLEIKKYPKLTEIAAFRPYPNWKAWWMGGRKYCSKDDPKAEGGYYTQEEARAIVEYARKLHINVIPEIEMPAHSEEVLAVYPELSCSGKPYENAEFCIGNEASFTFLQDILLEVMAVFPSQYIHVGGDEANKDPWKKCPKCQERMKDNQLKDVDELQSYLIHRMDEFLVKHGRILVGWDEILDGGLAPQAVVMSWRGEEGGIKAAKAGHDVIMTPGGYCYLDSYQDAPTTQPEAIGGYLTLERVYSYNPIPEALTAQEAKHIQGVQANVWAEYIPTPEHREYMIYPRLLALAEVAWTKPDQKNWDAFRKQALQEVGWLQNKGYNPFDLSKEIGERPEASLKAKHLGVKKKIIYTSPYSEHYTAGGDTALTDGVRGGWTYGDKKWQGFMTIDMDVTVDLEKETGISSVSAEFMQLIGPWVWLPREVIISVSNDGKSYTELKRLQNDVPTTEERLIYRTYSWEGKTKTRYVRYQALSNGTEGGWLFTDEIVIK